MEAIEGLKRAIHVTAELQTLVKTMKVLAGLNIRQYERAAHAVAEYNHTIEMGLRIALRRMPDPLPASPPDHARQLGAIVFGTDQGMCGQLNDIVAGHATRALKRLAARHGEQTILAVGQRVASALEDHGRTVSTTLNVPSSITGVGATVHELLRRVEEWRLAGHTGMVVLFHCRLTSGVFYRPRGILLLPVDPDWIRSLRVRKWPSRVLPAAFMESERLYRSLIREFLFVSLFRALTESLASENAARLASMQVAERNIDDRLKELTASFHHARQTAITSELLDIISGFEALK